ncbi:hypothetical protein GCM10025869_02310 [Homoserinibacter gongjuensis]|uniref:Uncharacterized protein n=1 Tax=Homoserinibacter gongjuensis TaxID=1162968 RepID=A0ABQ6JS99_9MICO|nr:hypothetical protein GCM10025869_02310 [Homoserinibacter gongjuensis]
MTTEDAGLTDRERLAQGMEVRRAVLSDAHVDVAAASATEFTAPWQDFITRVAWGRSGRDRDWTAARARSRCSARSSRTGTTRSSRCTCARRGATG